MNKNANDIAMAGDILQQALIGPWSASNCDRLLLSRIQTLKGGWSDESRHLASTLLRLLDDPTRKSTSLVDPKYMFDVGQRLTGAAKYVEANPSAWRSVELDLSFRRPLLKRDLNDEAVQWMGDLANRLVTAKCNAIRSAIAWVRFDIEGLDGTVRSRLNGLMQTDEPEHWAAGDTLWTDDADILSECALVASDQRLRNWTADVMNVVSDFGAIVWRARDRTVKVVPAGSAGRRLLNVVNRYAPGAFLITHGLGEAGLNLLSPAEDVDYEKCDA